MPPPPRYYAPHTQKENPPSLRKASPAPSSTSASTSTPLAHKHSLLNDNQNSPFSPSVKSSQRKLNFAAAAAASTPPVKQSAIKRLRGEGVADDASPSHSQPSASRRLRPHLALVSTSNDSPLRPRAPLLDSSDVVWLPHGSPKRAKGIAKSDECGNTTRVAAQTTRRPRAPGSARFRRLGKAESQDTCSGTRSSSSPSGSGGARKRPRARRFLKSLDDLYVPPRIPDTLDEIEHAPVTDDTAEKTYADSDTYFDHILDNAFPPDSLDAPLGPLETFEGDKTPLFDYDETLENLCLPNLSSAEDDDDDDQDICAEKILSFSDSPLLFPEVV